MREGGVKEGSVGTPKLPPSRALLLVVGRANDVPSRIAAVPHFPGQAL